MPYIGNDLATQFQAFATQTITGDGSTSYTLDRAVANGKELLVYINNVKQEEGSGKSYEASGTTITFSEAVASGDSCYLVYMGSAQQTVTAPDGSIVSGQIANATLALPSGLTVVGNTGIGTTSPATKLDVDGGANSDQATFSGTASRGLKISTFSVGAADEGVDFDAQASGSTQALTFSTGGTERVRVDGSGNVLVGTTDNNPNNNSADSTADNGTVIFPTGLISIATHQNAVMVANRTGNDGNLFDLRRSGATKGKIDVGSSSIAIFATGVNNGGWSFGDGAAILPMKDSALADNNMDLGSSSNRMDDIFATNSTIQTSDQNEKQDIASATTKELNVAKKLSALFKTFRWKDKVAEKGDKARTHTGIVAQEVQSAFKAEGLDASNYGLFTSDTWWEKEIKVDAVKADEEKGIEAKDAYTYIDTKDEKTDGYTERTRLGVRYPELFSFIFSSIEARLSALESK